MKISPFAKRNLSRIIPFGVFWLVFSIIYTLMEKGMLGDLQYYPATDNPYSFSQNILIVPILALTMGLIVGTIEVLYLNRLFSRMSLFKKILLKTLVYVIIMILFLIITSIISMSIYLKVGPFHQQVWHNLGALILILYQ